MVPDMYYPSIYAIDLALLRHKGIKSLIVDLDNTLVEATCPNATPKLMEWLAEVRKHGFRIMIVSNNTKTRVAQFAHPLEIPYIHTAKKPLSLSFRRALQILETKADETAVIGDQLLTDVLGGNRMGLHTILVVPISEVEGFFTRLNRRIEKLVFRWMKKRGILSWEELR
jgi:HAD superfamily phosphatase (TIGR01668 family)